MEEKLKKYLVGMGSFGNVYKLTYEDQEYAIKKIKINKPSDHQLSLNEIQIMKNLPSHRNIVKYYGHVFFHEKSQLYIAMEYIDGYNLDQIIKHIKPGILPQKLILNWLMQILLALRHLQKHKIIHRDIKPENIIISRLGVAKVIDFGLATLKQNSQLISKAGTPIYMSPEMCAREGYSFETDLWSLGATFYHLVTQISPFSNYIENYYSLKDIKEIQWMLMTQSEKQYSLKFQDILSYVYGLIIDRKIVSKSNYKIVDHLVNLLLNKSVKKRATIKQLFHFNAMRIQLQDFLNDKNIHIITETQKLFKNLIGSKSCKPSEQLVDGNSIIMLALSQEKFEELENRKESSSIFHISLESPRGIQESVVAAVDQVQKPEYMKTKKKTSQLNSEMNSNHTVRISETKLVSELRDNFSIEQAKVESMELQLQSWLNETNDN